jgi:hypothetical protein
VNSQKTWETFTATIAELKQQLDQARRRARYQQERAEHWKQRALRKAAKR